MLNRQRSLLLELLFYPLQVATILYRTNAQLPDTWDEPDSMTVGFLALSCPFMVFGHGYEDTVPWASSIAIQMAKNWGLSQCYKGFDIKLCCLIVLNPLINAIWRLINGCPFSYDKEVEFTTEMYHQALRVIVTHPCHVVMVLSISHNCGNNLDIVAAILRQLGYEGFFLGMATRLWATFVFYGVGGVLSWILNLPRRHSKDTTQAILMLTRDAIARLMSTPIYGLSTIRIANVELDCI